MSLILRPSFYCRNDVVQIARELLGKVLITQMDGQITSGIIIETEAYNGTIDRASHSYGGRKTKRTEIMYRKGGIAYIYLCYGIHSLFNIVTNHSCIPHAVLIRSIRPLEGKDVMLSRLKTGNINDEIGIGPGRVTKILGIHYTSSGHDLTKKPKVIDELGIWLEDRGHSYIQEDILTTPRIGVSYAGEDALLPYRFLVKT